MRDESIIREHLAGIIESRDQYIIAIGYEKILSKAGDDEADIRAESYAESAERDEIVIGALRWVLGESDNLA